MRYDFTCKETTISGWEEILRHMTETFHDAADGKYSEDEFKAFMEKAAADAEPLKHKPSFIHWGFDAPQTMPADSRCDFFYKPTYLMLLTLIAGINHYPALMEGNRVKKVVGGALACSTGRKLGGHGYEEAADLLNNLRLFHEGGIVPFLASYPDLCPEFAQMLDKVLKGMRKAADEGHGGEELSEVLALFGR